MDAPMPSHPQTITTIAELDALYGEASGPAVIKELGHISDHYRRFIEVSPFMILATVGPEGMDCSPRGDPPGFVRVVDRKTVMIPDRRGNNRVASLRNIVRAPRVALLFLIPGIGATMRINGRAALITDTELCASFAIQNKPAKCVIVVTADRVYPQCPRARVPSGRWDPALHLRPADLPTSGEMMEAISNGAIDGKALDAAYPERLKQTIY